MQRPTRRLLAPLLICLVLASAFAWWQQSGPQPPELKLDGLEPAIANVLQRCKTVVADHPRSGAAWGQLGMALFVYDFKDEARACFDNAERFDPSNPRWPYFNGVLLIPHDTKLALEKLRRAVELDGNQNAAVRRRFANVLSELGQYEKAERQFQTILERWPDDPGAIFGLGRLRYAQGNFSESVRYLEQAADSPFTRKSAQQLLVTVYERLGKAELASQIENKVSRLPADRPLEDPFVDEASRLRTGLRAWVDYGGLLVRKGQIDQAKPVAQRAVKHYPDSAEAWLLMAQIHRAERKHQQALNASRKAVSLAPHAVEPYVQQGVAQIMVGKIDAAIESLKRAIELKPQLSQAHHNLALCYFRKGQWDQATEAFRDAIQFNPGFIDSHLGLAEAQVKTGDRAAAEQTMVKLLKLAPDDPRVGQLMKRYGLEEMTP